MSEAPKHSAERGYNWSKTESGLYVPESKWGEKPASEQIVPDPEAAEKASQKEIDDLFESFQKEDLEALAKIEELVRDGKIRDEKELRKALADHGEGSPLYVASELTKKELESLLEKIESAKSNSPEEVATSQGWQTHRQSIEDLTRQLEDHNSSEDLSKLGEAHSKGWLARQANITEELSEAQATWDKLGGTEIDKHEAAIRQIETEISNAIDNNANDAGVREALGAKLVAEQEALVSARSEFDKNAAGEGESVAESQAPAETASPDGVEEDHDLDEHVGEVLPAGVQEELAKELSPAEAETSTPENPDTTVEEQPKAETPESTTPTSPEASVPENIESPESVESAEYGLDNAMCAAIASYLFGGKMSVDRIADIIRANNPGITSLETSYAVLDVLQRGLDYMAENPTGFARTGLSSATQEAPAAAEITDTPGLVADTGPTVTASGEFGGQKLNPGTFEVKPPGAEPITPAVAEAIAVTRGIIDQGNPYKNETPEGDTEADGTSQKERQLAVLDKVLATGRSAEIAGGGENQEVTKPQQFKRIFGRAVRALLAVGVAAGLVSGPGATQTAVAENGPDTSQTGEIQSILERQMNRSAEDAAAKAEKENSAETLKAPEFADPNRTDPNFLSAPLNLDINNSTPEQVAAWFNGAGTVMDATRSWVLIETVNTGVVPNTDRVNAKAQEIKENPQMVGDIAEQINELHASGKVNWKEGPKLGLTGKSVYLSSKSDHTEVVESVVKRNNIRNTIQTDIVNSETGEVVAVMRWIKECGQYEVAPVGRGVSNQVLHSSAPKSSTPRTPVEVSVPRGVQVVFTEEEIAAPVKEVVEEVIQEAETPPEVVTPDIPNKPVTPDIPDKPAVSDTPVIPDSPVKENPPVVTIDDNKLKDKDPTKSIEGNPNLNEGDRSTVKDNKVDTNIGNEPDKQAVIAPDNGKAPAPAAEPVTVESTDSQGEVVEQSTEDRDTAIQEAAPADSSGKTGDGAPLESGQVD